MTIVGVQNVNWALPLVALMGGCVLTALLFIIPARHIKYGLDLVIVGLICVLVSTSTCMLAVGVYRHHHPLKQDSLRTALVQNGLSEAKLDSTVEKVLNWEPGKHTQVQNVLVVAGDANTFFVGVKRG